MIFSLPFTIIIESVVVIGYTLRRRISTGPVLVTGILANLITQSLLWIGLNIFHRHYLPALFVGEILVWMIEALVLHRIPANRLELRESLALSLMMNLASFGIGWFLPV